MANIHSAAKAARQALKRKTFNARRKKAVKLAIKAVEAGVSAETISGAYQAIDKAAKSGVIKKNTAARMKSRIAKTGKK